MLTKEEKELLDKLTLNAIANGNTVSPAVCDLTPAEYKTLYQIRIKLELN